MPSVDLIRGDCRDAMLRLSVGPLFDSVVTDPPYGLVSTVKRFGKPGSAPAKSDGPTGVYARASKGFMNKLWDGTGVETDPVTWALAWDCLKPGGHLVAFGGTRTFHRIAVAIEDAGFEIRDCLMWVYGVGFPKSHDISKAIDREAGAVRQVVGANPNPRAVSGVDYEGVYAGGNTGSATITAPATPEAAAWQGWGTALKPAWEPILVARKPLAYGATVAGNVLAHGVGALNIDACRVAHGDEVDTSAVQRQQHSDGTIKGAFGAASLIGKEIQKYKAGGRWPANVLHDGSAEVLDAFAAYGGAARFFYSSKASAADRVSRNIEEVEIEWISDAGPHRLVLQADTEPLPGRVIVASGSADSSEWSTFLCGSGIAELCRRASKCITSTRTSSTTESRTWKSLTTSLINASTADAGSLAASGSNPAASAGGNLLSATIIVGATESLPGASRAVSGTPLKINVNARRTGHPTCKPIALMRWLVQLVTPPGGRVLDPFAGSGTTLQAAYELGCSAIGCEADPEYQGDIERRISRMTDELEGCLA